jgi:hypothetical protein
VLVLVLVLVSRSGPESTTLRGYCQRRGHPAFAASGSRSVVIACIVHCRSERYRRCVSTGSTASSSFADKSPLTLLLRDGGGGRGDDGAACPTVPPSVRSPASNRPRPSGATAARALRTMAITVSCAPPERPRPSDRRQNTSSRRSCAATEPGHSSTALAASAEAASRFASAMWQPARRSAIAIDRHTTTTKAPPVK